MSTFARENNASRAMIETNAVYASGAFKDVFKGVYNEGERAGQDCACKIFKSGSVFQASYFDAELKVVAKSLEIVNRFNNDHVINRHIWVNQPEVWTFDEGSSRPGEKNLVEPMIANFEKFNSNTGWSPLDASPWTDVMQALSHYSYHSSGGQLIICDLQGGVYKDGFIITDPVIMSNSQEYGPTDLGRPGIATFFGRHTCNKFCNCQWTAPRDQRPYFKVQQGTSMVVPTRQSRAPLSGAY
jgi:hypothetical protein